MPPFIFDRESIKHGLGDSESKSVHLTGVGQVQYQGSRSPPGVVDDGLDSGKPASSVFTQFIE